MSVLAGRTGRRWRVRQPAHRRGALSLDLHAVWWIWQVISRLSTTSTSSATTFEPWLTSCASWLYTGPRLLWRQECQRRSALLSTSSLRIATRPRGPGTNLQLPGRLIFVLVRIRSSIRAQYTTNTDSIQKVCIQYFHDVFACIGLYSFVLVCIVIY